MSIASSFDPAALVTGSPGADQVQLSAADDLYDGAGGDDTIRGGGGLDRLIGGLGSDRLFGDDGDDILAGGGGTDRFDGGAGSDTALFHEVTIGMTADLALGRVSYARANWAAETLVSIENVETGSAADTVIGSALGNVILTRGGNDSVRAGGGNDRVDGGDGSDILRGGAGNDLLTGGAGEDRLFGEGGHDTLVGGTWRDRLDGGAGSDTVVYEEASVAIDLARGVARFPDTTYPTETLVSIENVVAGAGDDAVLGSAAANRIEAGNGFNTVRGGGGDDVLIGGWTGGDILDGGDGDDLIFGNGTDTEYQGGEDRLLGGNGDDVLHGGFGSQTMSGGAGADIFVFTDETQFSDGVYTYESGQGARITDFSRAEGDKIRIELTNTGSEGRVPRFVGAAADLELYDFGFRESSPGTIVDFVIGEGWDGYFPREYEPHAYDVSVSIRLDDLAYDPIASDFLFV